MGGSKVAPYGGIDFGQTRADNMAFDDDNMMQVDGGGGDHEASINQDWIGQC